MAPGKPARRATLKVTIMYDEFKLSAKQRGYKQAGKRLQPRCGYDAYERDGLKLHNMRELRRYRIGEYEAAVRSMGRPDPQPHMRRMERAIVKLGAAQQRRLYELLDAHSGTVPVLPPAMRRAYVAAIEADAIERCIQHDDMMWANCK